MKYEKIKQWWKGESHSKKVLWVYVAILIFLYLLAVINGFIFDTFTKSIQRTQDLPYVCNYVDEIYECSFKDYISNVFISFPYLQFVYLSIISVSDVIYRKSIPDYFDYTSIVPILIGIYYISIPITIISLFIRNRIKK